MGQIIGAAVFAGLLALFAALIKDSLKLSATTSTALGLLCTAALGFALLAAYESHQRSVQQAAYEKKICSVRVDLDADLVARGKPPLYPNLSAADCK